MKKQYTILSLLFAGYCTVAVSQNNRSFEKSIVTENKKVHSLNPAVPSPAFLNNVELESTDCISKEMQKQMWDETQQNIQMLRKKNPDACKITSMVHPLFIWPTQPKAGFTDYGYYTVHNLVDHNPAYPNQLLDYNCGSRTYDFGSGNHGGTDIILWPYAWRRMDEQVMEVIAAAPGIIVNKVDGNFDRNCANNGAGTWNAIHVQHDDGSIAWYLHFKTGSLTAKNVGDSVALGEYLGTAGSSGSSDWPHLHFQVMDSNGGLIDPWDGTCNSFNAGDSWWLAQQTYNVPSVNRICTKSTLLDYYSCPNPEITFEKDTFNINDSLCLWIYTRDLELNSNVQINIYNPNMQNLINWVFTVPWATAPTSYIRWYYVVDSWWTPGWWTFETVYGGNTYQHQFYMTQSAVGIAEQNTTNATIVFPNPASGMLEVRGLNVEAGSEIKIMDMTGKEVYQNKVTQHELTFTLQTSNFENGIYFIQIKSGKKTETQKLIVQN